MKKTDFLVGISGTVIWVYYIWTETMFMIFLMNIKYEHNPLRFLFPYSIDHRRGPRPEKFSMENLYFNFFLVFIFGFHHTLFARQFMKNLLSKIGIGQKIERSLYVLVSNLLMHFIFHFWRHVGPTMYVWQIFDPDEFVVYRYLGEIIGFIFVYMASIVLDHFGLLGVKQAWGVEPDESFSTPSIYKIVRNPTYLGYYIAFWIVPVMSYSRLMVVIFFTIYIIIGSTFEERDLNKYVPEYTEYKKRVPDTSFPIKLLLRKIIGGGNKQQQQKEDAEKSD